MTMVFFDTETTDIKPGQIAQLSYIVTDDGLSVIKAKNHYFSVDSISKGAYRVHGLSAQKLQELSGGKRFCDNCDDIIKDFKGSYLVAHNISFDIRFLNNEFLQKGHRVQNDAGFCTMRYFTPICGIRKSNGSLKWPRLGEVLDHLKITTTEIKEFTKQTFGDYGVGFHDARFDASSVLLIYKSLFEKKS